MIKKMNKKAYIIPEMNSRHMVLAGAIADGFPIYSDGGSVEGELTKERKEDDMAESEGWTEKGLW